MTSKAQAHTMPLSIESVQVFTPSDSQSKAGDFTPCTVSSWLPALSNWVSSMSRSSQPASTATTAAPPLVLFFALPLISAEVAEKIKAGQFIDSKELVVDTVALLQWLCEVGVAQQCQALLINSRQRELQDSLSWVFFALSFLAVCLNTQEARDLAAYGQMIIHLYTCKHSVCSLDSNFSSTPWISGTVWQIKDRQQ